MSEISALPSGIVEWLKSREELSGIIFLTEFPAIKKAVPLKHTTVAVGINGMEIVDAFSENDEGILEREEFCRTAKITLRLSIHAPFSAGGSACHEAFANIIDCLTFESSLNILTSGCDDIISDRDTDAFVLRAWLKVEANLCPAATSSLPLPSFFSKDLLCGSHIRDENIHLTLEQQEFLDSPVICTAYFGTGGNSEECVLGFRPRFVFVSRAGFPISDYDFNDRMNIVSSAIGGSMGTTLGIELTNRGIRIHNSSEYEHLGYRIALNTLGTSYLVFAIK